MLKARIIPCLDVKDGPFTRSSIHAARTKKSI